MIKFIFGLTCLMLFTPESHAQDSTSRFSIHAQATYIVQHKNAFKAPYSGEHSLLTTAETQTSITSTLFMAMRLWKGSSIVLNPEIAGGSGLSQVYGLASATNGETFRIGSPSPKLYVARLYYRQLFPLSRKYTSQDEGFNQLKQQVPESYFAFTIGKVSIADFFDQNSYSHDPRTQFMNWALMSNGAWDYAANTRGYTPSFIMEYSSPKLDLRYAYSLEPIIANGSKMDWNVHKSGAQVLELTRRLTLQNKPATLRVLGFYNRANMGDYRQAISRTSSEGVAAITGLEATRSYNNHKYGFAINTEKEISDDLGAFVRVAWNDARKETWAFTEIDRSVSGGFSLKGNKWKRAEDVFGIGGAIAGISKDHQAYLNAGGNGFMLGDGKLNYKPEKIGEMYYSANLKSENIFLTAGYQIILNPGYNSDRKAPVSVFSLRTHFSI